MPRSKKPQPKSRGAIRVTHHGRRPVMVFNDDIAYAAKLLKPLADDAAMLSERTRDTVRLALKALGYHVKFMSNVHTHPTAPQPMLYTTADSYAGARRIPMPVAPTGDVKPELTVPATKPIGRMVGFLPNGGGPAITFDTVQESLVKGRKIDAIAGYRKLTGLGIKESVDAINKAIETGKLDLP